MIGTETTVEMYAAGDLLLLSYLSSAMPSGQLPNQHASSSCFNLLRNLQCSQRSCMVIMINGLRVLFRNKDLNALMSLPFIVNKLCASHYDVQKHESCCSEWPVILSETKVVFETHALAQCAAVSKQISQREASGMATMHFSL